MVRFACLTATAIENDILSHEARERAREIETTAELARLVASSLDLDEVYERFAQEVRKAVPFDRIPELSWVAWSHDLSSRQQEILRLIADGVLSREIAARLPMNQATLSRQLRHVFDLFGVDDRAHAIAEAYRKNLL